MLTDLFRWMSQHCRVDRWSCVLRYRFVPGRGRIDPFTQEPLLDRLESVYRQIEYDAVPLVAVLHDEERTHYTLRLVYHAPTSRYYYGTIRTRYGGISITVGWYAVPEHWNEQLEQWLRRYYRTELPRTIDAELIYHEPAHC